MNVQNSVCLVYAKFYGLSCIVPGYRIFWGTLSRYSGSCTSLTRTLAILKWSSNILTVPHRSDMSVHIIYHPPKQMPKCELLVLQVFCLYFWTSFGVFAEFGDLLMTAWRFTNCCWYLTDTVQLMNTYSTKQRYDIWACLKMMTRSWVACLANIAFIAWGYI